jgi:hypothetical protein
LSKLCSIADITCAVAIDDTIVDKTYVVTDKEWMQIRWVKSVGCDTEVNKHWIVGCFGQLVYSVVLVDKVVKVTASYIESVVVGLLEHSKFAVVYIQHTSAVIVRYPAVRQFFTG